MNKSEKSDLFNNVDKGKAKPEAGLVIANEEKAKRAAELVIANEEKGKRAAELVIANAEKAKRAAELVIANSEKVKRAARLVIANTEKAKRADELIIAGKELAYQNEEKVKRAAELVIAEVNKTKREAELVIAKIEKAKRIAKLIIAGKELSFQTEEKSKLAAELVIADAEKAKREAELVIANIKKAKRSAELAIANVEKAKRSAELVIANRDLVYQKSEKSKRAAELIIANVEKAKRAAELVIANIEKAKRAAELVITNKELVLATERARLTAELIILNKQLTHQIEKRKKAEEAVNFQKIKLELALQSSQLGTWEFNIVENKRFFDNQACYFLGIDPATFGGTTEEFYAAVHPDDHEKLRGALKKTVEQDVFYDPEYRTIWHDGSIHHMSARGNLLYDDKGNPQMISGIIWDNTGNKQKEEELMNSEAKHSSMISNISDVIGIIGLDGFMKYKSPNIEKWFGWQPQDLIGTDGFSNVHPDDMERVKKEFYALLEKENSTITLEYKYKCKDGSYKQVEITAKNLINDHVINGVLLNYRDITDRKQVENALRESEKRFKAIFNQAPIAIALLDTEGNTIISNLPLTNMVGYSNDELSKMKFTDYTYPEDADKDMNQFIDLIEGRITNYSMEKRFVHKNGNLVWGNLFVTIIHDEDGMSKEIIGMAVDITERKQTESELIKAKEKAEESDRLKSAFLTNMSHEVRTPMNGILGFAELLKEPNLTIDEQQDYIQTMQISGARMLSTINSIIDISRIESGLIVMDIKETNLNEKIEFTYKFFKPEVVIKGLAFLFRNGLPTNEAIIKTDNEKVYGILTNLVRNAIKFTYDGSIEFGYEKKGEYLEFYVKDTGIGIPQKQQQLIFERFRQGSESHNRDYEGSGLGLSISKCYVEMLGGRIWVESEEGLGSTFYFTIPYNPVLEETSAIENVASPEHKEVQLKYLKILIVEDDEISYSLLSRTIQKISKEVLHAISGVEAVEACRNNPDLDLVLMDIRMPQMNGLEATQQIRQFNKDVIIIAQTAYAFSGDSEKAIQAGCNDYITKPINRTLLFKLIEEHVNK